MQVQAALPVPPAHDQTHEAVCPLQDGGQGHADEVVLLPGGDRCVYYIQVEASLSSSEHELCRSIKPEKEKNMFGVENKQRNLWVFFLDGFITLN